MLRKILVLFGLFLLPPQSPATTFLKGTKDSLYGRWKFQKMIYQNQVLFPQDPNLELTLEFRQPNESILYWTFSRGNRFCEGKGTFEWDGHLLVNEINWLNSANDTSCRTASDMQLGRKTQTPAWLYEDLLNLDLGFGSDSLIYVWKKVQSF